MANNTCTIGVGKLRKVALSFYQDILLNLYNVKIKMDSQDKKFESDRELPSHIAVDLNSVNNRVCERIGMVFSEDDEQFETMKKICRNLVEHRSVRDLLDDVTDISSVAVKTVKDWGVENEEYVGIVPTIEGVEGFVEATIDEDNNRVYIHWETNIHANTFMEAVSKMAQLLRDQKRQPTTDEYLVFQLAYYQLSQGERLPNLNQARCLGTPGFRPHTQTYMSLTDPGDGHVLGTTRFNDWMKGAIVHVEHLERPRHLPRENIESYRVPSIFDFSKVRLHVGSAAPTTYFFGRRVKDSGNFEEDFLRLVHITSATATAAFFQGAAECKIAMEGLSTSQAVRFMQALRGQVQRKRQQFLSAAWNLNQTILDDFDRDEPVHLSQRMEIATRAIDIVSRGGFDKITWDGASDTYPSKCIMYQLSFEEALTIVHEAHMKGLVTYFSAGFKFNEIKHAVYAGVDGIGIGGAQVLRFMDSDTGMHGPYTEENIPRIMASRDEAAASIRGRGVHLLARLDTMFYEGSISCKQNKLREELYQSLLAVDEERISKLISDLQDVVNLCCEGNSPIVGTARRLICAKDPLLKENAENQGAWEAFIRQLKTSVLAKDTESLYEEYDSDPWLTLRRGYRSRQMRSVTRQCSFDVTLKSFK